MIRYIHANVLKRQLAEAVYKLQSNRFKEHAETWARSSRARRHVARESQARSGSLTALYSIIHITASDGVKLAST